jgi:hypothetical protein
MKRKRAASRPEIDVNYLITNQPTSQRPNVQASKRPNALHIPAFPAWAFVRTGRPEHPLAVVEKGKVVAATRQAERAGVTPGMPAERAGQLLPGLRIRERDPGLETAAWEAFLDELNELTPFIEPISPGWAFFRDADSEGLRALVARTGAGAGSAPYRGAAKLTAIRAAPGNILSADEVALPHFLERFPIERLMALGFPEEFIDQMKLLGYGSLCRAQALTHRQITGQFGEEGEALFALLHPGPDERIVGHYRRPPSITVSFDFEPEAEEPGEVEPVLADLVEKAVERLEGWRTQRIVLRLRLRSGERITSRVLAEPTADPSAIRQNARTLLGEAWGEESRRWTVDSGQGEGVESGEWRVESVRDDSEGKRMAEGTTKAGAASPSTVHCLLSTSTSPTPHALRPTPHDHSLSTIHISLTALTPFRPDQPSLFFTRPKVQRVVRFIHRKYPKAMKRASIQRHALFEEDRVCLKEWDGGSA